MLLQVRRTKFKSFRSARGKLIFLKNNVEIKNCFSFCYEDSPYIFVKTQFSLALTIFHLIDIECKFHISVYLLFCWIRDE